MSNYIGETPSTVDLEPEIPEFFTKFYTVSDDPAKHEEYAKSFSQKGTLIMGTKHVEGYAQILEFRKGLWAGPVATRKHTLKKIFPFGDSSNEVMLYGTVKYGLKNGDEVHVDWSARALMEKEKGGRGKYVMHFYQVYLDSAPMAAAAAKIAGS